MKIVFILIFGVWLFAIEVLTMSETQSKNHGMRVREKSWIDLESPYRLRIRRSYEVTKPESYVPSDPISSPKRVRSRRDYTGSDRDMLKSGTTNRTHDTTRTARTNRSSRTNGVFSSRTNGSYSGSQSHREGSFWSGGIKREGSIMRSDLSMVDGVPEVPLDEAPTIVTTAGSFRLSYNDINKLSYRRIAQEAPPNRQLRDREDSFVNDAIITERKRTKYKDIIPNYSADGDKHCTGYFKRPDVQKLLDMTCTLKPWERDIKPEYIRMEKNPYL